MITKDEYEAIKARVERGEMPTEEEMSQLLEYSVAAAEESLKRQGIEATCPHCGAKLPPGVLTCTFCGKNVYDPVE